MELQSRQQRLLTAHFPDVAAALTGVAAKAVLDGEVVIWNAGRFDFAALQDRLRSGPRRAHTLAAAMPAAFVVFDLLAHGRTDLRDQPYRHRRDALEALLGRGLPDGLVLTPSTTRRGGRPQLADATTARGSAGIEGVVAKRLDQPYRPGVRGWQKLRSRLTAEAVVGGVIGPLNAPRVLLLGRHDHRRAAASGRPHHRAHPRRRARRSPRGCARRTGPGHPWPNPLPSTRWGRPGTPTAYTPVAPGGGRRAHRRHRGRAPPLAPPRPLRPRPCGPAQRRPHPAAPYPGLDPPTAAGPGRVAPGGNRPAHRVDGAGVVPRGDLDISITALIATAASLSATSTAVRAT